MQLSLIGMFGFYQEFIPLFQTRIAPWRKLQVGQPLPGQLTAETERSFFKEFWLPEHQQLLEELKKELLSGLLLARPNPNRRFYVKTDWSRLAMGAVLLQAKNDDDSAQQKNWKPKEDHASLNYKHMASDSGQSHASQVPQRQPNNHTIHTQEKLQ